MKKLGFTTTLLLLAISGAWAEDSSTTDAAPAQTSTTPVERVKPTPQETRINSLIERLSTNYSQEIETLNANSKQFLGLFRESETGDPQGCVIMLHGDHGHPDWPQVIAPLRNNLVKHSWCTLSIEIPDVQNRAALTVVPSPTTNTETNNTTQLPNEATVFARIDAAIALTKEKGYNQVAYLGYRSGAAYALRYTAEQGTTGQALVLIEPRTIAPVSEYQLAENIQQLRLPTLDYFFNNNEHVARFARWRQSAANKRSNQGPVYTQLDAMPDNRYDPIGNKRLEQRVWGFLKQNTTQKSQRKELPEFSKELFYQSPLD